MNNKCFLLVSMVILFYSGCSIYHSSYDTHYLYYQNTSSHDVFIQYFLDGNHYNYDVDGFEDDIYRITINVIPKMTDFEITLGSSDYDPIKKIIIADNNTNKLLKKIDGANFWDMLILKEKWVEESSHETITRYRHYFIITDELLNNEG